MDGVAQQKNFALVKLPFEKIVAFAVVFVGGDFIAVLGKQFNVGIDGPPLQSQIVFVFQMLFDLVDGERMFLIGAAP